jgi:hypothetical protein
VREAVGAFELVVVRLDIRLVNDAVDAVDVESSPPHFAPGGQAVTVTSRVTVVVLTLQVVEVGDRTLLEATMLNNVLLDSRGGL